MIPNFFHLAWALSAHNLIPGAASLPSPLPLSPLRVAVLTHDP